MQFKKILVPIDFSETSDKAVELAALMAAKFEAEVTLLHVVVLFKVEDADLEGKLDFYEHLFTKLRNEAEKKLGDREQRVAKHKVPVHKIIMKGIAASDTILDYIKEHEPDLVIMGTHGKTGLQKVIQGSVTERVVRLSPVPVLTVHPNSPSIDFDNILVPFDFSVYSQAALKTAVELAVKYHAHVHVLHVVQREVHPSFYSAGITSLFELDPDLKNRIYNKMEESVKQFKDQIKDVKFVIKEGKPVKEILNYASNNMIDLLVMGTHGLTGMDHLLMGSVTEKVVRHARTPVLVVKIEK